MHANEKQLLSLPSLVVEVHGPHGLCQKMALNHQIFINYGKKDFFTRLVTGYESWVHYHTSEKKSQSVQWKQHRHRQPKKFL